MENFLRILGYALTREDSRLGRFKVRYLTILITLTMVAGAVLIGLNFRHFSYHVLIAAGITLLAYLFIVFSIQESLLKFRTARRRALYQRWQYQYTLPNVGDPRVDSSLAIAILWHWRQASVVQVQAQGNLQDNAAGKMREITTTLQNVFATTDPWVIDVDRYRQNTIYAYTVPRNSFAHKYFQAQLTIFEISQNALDHRNLPTIQFENLVELDEQIYFDSAVLGGFQAQYFAPDAANYAKQAFLDNFIERDEYHVWEIVTRGNGMVAFVQVELPH